MNLHSFNFELILNRRVTVLWQFTILYFTPIYTICRETMNIEKNYTIKILKKKITLKKIFKNVMPNENESRGKKEKIGGRSELKVCRWKLENNRSSYNSQPRNDADRVQQFRAIPLEYRAFRECGSAFPWLPALLSYTSISFSIVSHVS